MRIHAEIRSGRDATTRRTRPNWLVECIKAGISLHALPEAPAYDATHQEKAAYTWKLRELWEKKTGRKIERLTPDGYNAKLESKRKAVLAARKSPTAHAIDTVLAQVPSRRCSQSAGIRNNARHQDYIICQEIRDGSPWTNIDTRVVYEDAGRLERVSQTVPAGHSWVPDEKLTETKVKARDASVTRRVSKTVYTPSGVSQ